MKLSDIRDIVIAQSLEESDTGGRLLSDDEKRIAESAAGAPLPTGTGKSKQNQFLAKRAAGLIGTAESRLKGEVTWLRANPFRSKFGLFALITVVVAAIIGYLTNELDDPDGRINILKFPLIGIILWNLIVYLCELFIIFRKDGASKGVSGIITRALYPPPVNLQRSDNEPNVEFRARSVFLSRWRHLSFPALSARLKSLLHFTALILAASAITGMYVKGIAKQYNAVWESTFIKDGEQLRQILTTVLGPATIIKGDEIPPASDLNDWQAPNEKSQDNAAKWIHWYAITIGIYVLIPRLILGFIWLIRANAHDKTLPFRELAPNYYERVLAVSTGDSLSIGIVPYAHKPGDNVIQGIRTYMETHFERPVTIKWLDSIAFGDEEDAEAGDLKGLQPMLLFNFGSTPEKETHLALYQKLAGDLPPDSTKYQVVLDCEAFDRKSESFNDADERRTTRLEAWKKLFSTEDCEIHVISDHSIAVKDDEPNG